MKSIVLSECEGMELSDETPCVCSGCTDGSM